MATLPHGWEEYTCEAQGTQYSYYFNRFTQETTWERPASKRKRPLSRGQSGPSGCFLWPARTQVPARRSKMRQSKEVFAAILKRGMPALGNEGEWWRGSKEHHAFLPLETLVACARVSKAWHAALVEKGFDYGVAVLGISLARWRVKNVAGGPCDDVDAPAELSKRLSIRMQSETMASGQRLREVRQFLCRHAELSQKNATCREDASAKAFLPALFQGESWQQIFNPAFWLSLTAVEPSGSYLSDGVKGMMWAFSTPANLPNEYLVVQEASDAVHVEDDDGDSDSDWGEQDETLVCRECKEDFVFTKGEQIFYRQKGLESKPGRCKACLSKAKRPKNAAVPVAKAEVKGGKGVQITGKPGGGGVAGSSGYKISNRQATRDMDWLCAISSMEGTQHKTMRRTDPKPTE